MEVSYGKNLRHMVTSAWLAGVPVDEIWLNGEKLYPEEGSVVQELAVDTTLANVHGELNYWMHALAYHDGLSQRTVYEYGPWIYVKTAPLPAASSTANQLKSAGWDVKLEGTGHKRTVYKRTKTVSTEAQQPSLFTLIIGEQEYKEGKDFYINPHTGYIEFFGNAQMPEISALQEGETVKLRASLPARSDRTATVGTTYYSLPFIAGTYFVCFYVKGGKRSPVGMIFNAAGSPSGNVYAHAEGNQQGHWTGNVWYTTPPQGLGNGGWNAAWGSYRWIAGDTGYTITVTQHYEWAAQQATPYYPAFTKEWSLDVVGAVIKQV